MLYRDWMKRSAGGIGHPRSHLLAVVDRAFRSLETRPTRPAAEALMVALDAWKKSKPDWSRSIRNRHGAVDDLTRWAEHKLKVLGGGASLMLAAQAARSRALLQEQGANQVSREVEQTITGDPQFGDQTFRWRVKLELIKRGTVVEARVRIKAKNQEGKALASDVQKAWNTHIESAWNVATVVEGNGVRRRHYDLLFGIDWVDLSYSGECYEVDSRRPPPDPALKAHYLMRRAANLGPLSDAQRSQQLREAASEWEGGSAWGFRANMAAWCETDRQAIIHEFGHVIGNPDEYLCSQIRGFGHTYDGAVYNNPPFSTDSIMNNTSSSGRIHERHFRFVQMVYRRWQPGSGAEVKIIRNIGLDASAEDRQLLVHAMAARRRAMGYDED